jgi:hypothetical protein
MLISEISPEWKVWIWQNVVKGIDKESIFNVLLNYGFEYNIIQKELDYEPVNPMVWKRSYNQQTFGELGKETIQPLTKKLADNPQIFRWETHKVEVYHLPEFLLSSDCEKIINKDENIMSEFNTTLHNFMGVDVSLDGGITHHTIEEGVVLPMEELTDIEWCIVIFLNDHQDGGELIFDNIDKLYGPKQGDAIVWRNIYPSGNINKDAEFHFQDVTSDKMECVVKYFKRPELVAQVISIDV